MSAAQRNTLIQHALNMGDLFAQNAALKHGLPDKPPRPVLPVQPDEPVVLRLLTDQPLATATATANPPPAADGPALAQAIPLSTAGGWIKKAAMVGALALGTGGLGGGLLVNALNRVQKPTPQNASPAIVQQADQSLLTYLQEEGYHLPPEKARKK